MKVSLSEGMRPVGGRVFSVSRLPARGDVEGREPVSRGPS